MKRNGIGCHVGPVYACAFRYADAMWRALIAPSLYSLKCVIATCEEFAKKHQITFNPTKSELLCFNASNAVTTHIKLNGQPVSVVHKDKHLGNYISNSIHVRHILINVCDLYQRSNLIISQFRSCDGETLNRLHETYCMYMTVYGSELWNLSCNYIKNCKVAWTKIKRIIWNIPPRTRNNLVSTYVTDNIDTVVESPSGVHQYQVHIVLHDSISLWILV